MPHLVGHGNVWMNKTLSVDSVLSAMIEVYRDFADMGKGLNSEKRENNIKSFIKDSYLKS